jgi:hypothetical protein
MGAFNTLSHALGGGERIIKYKQEKMIDLVEGHVDKDEFLVGKNGICATLTMRWLAQRLGKATSTSDPGFGQGDARSEERLIANMQTTEQSLLMYRELKTLGQTSSK